MNYFKLRELVNQSYDYNSTMFISTRDSKSIPKTYFLDEALEKGLAPDSGLFLPEKLPKVKKELLDALPSLNYSEVAWVILRHFLSISSIGDAELASLCIRAYRDMNVPLNHINSNIVIASLDKGPTASFKDFAAQFLALLMDLHLTRTGRHFTIIAVTSGDTGAAIQHAFKGLPNIKVIVYYPCSGISKLQEKHILSFGNAIPVDGNFDDCQKIAKTLLHNREISNKYNLTSANSISVWRLLPQIVYYFYIWSRMHSNKLMFSTPTGNCGNLTGGLMAKLMGLPVGRFIAGTNANNVFANIIGKGTIKGSLPFRQTSANAMDIWVPSNLERILYLYGEKPNNIPVILKGEMSVSGDVFNRLRKDIFAEDVITDEDIEAHILRMWYKYHFVIEPHGAIGVAASFRYRQFFNDQNSKIVVLETAAPAKFAEIFKYNGLKDIPIPKCKVLDKLKDVDIEKLRPKPIQPTVEEAIKKLDEIS